MHCRSDPSLILTEDCIQSRKRECHVHEFHILTEPIRDNSYICTGKEVEGRSAGFATSAEVVVYQKHEGSTT